MPSQNFHFNMEIHVILSCLKNRPSQNQKTSPIAWHCTTFSSPTALLQHCQLTMDHLPSTLGDIFMVGNACMCFCYPHPFSINISVCIIIISHDKLLNLCLLCGYPFTDYVKTSDHRILISVGVTLMLSVTFNLVLIICVVKFLRRAKQEIPTTEPTEPANHRVLNPVYEEIDELNFVDAGNATLTFEPDTIRNDCYQIKPDPKTKINGCYHHVLDPSTTGSACYQPSTTSHHAIDIQ